MITICFSLEILGKSHTLICGEFPNPNQKNPMDF